jgi:hypothetical protein
MPIGKRVLNRYSSPYIVVREEQTLGYAIDKLEETGYATNTTYLVFIKDDKYYVIPFSNLKTIVDLVGPKAFEISIIDLPMAEAQRVVSVNTSESSGQVRKWIALHPEAIVVIIDEQAHVVGLFANPNLSGAIGPLLTILHGRPVPLSQDYRRNIQTNTERPQCPKCGRLTFFDFIPETKEYRCPKCRATFELL